MHCSGLRLDNSKGGVDLKIQRKGSGSGTVNCHIFVIADAQFDILNSNLQSCYVLVDAWIHTSFRITLSLLGRQIQARPSF